MITEVKRHMPRAPRAQAEWEDRQYARACAFLLGAFLTRGDEAAVSETIRWAGTDALDASDRAIALTTLVEAGRGADAMAVAAVTPRQMDEDLRAYFSIAIAAGRRGDRSLYEQALAAARRIPLSSLLSPEAAEADRVARVAVAMVEAGQLTDALRAAAGMNAVGKAQVHAAIAQFYLEQNDRVNAAMYARMAAGVAKSEDMRPPHAFTEIGRRLAKVGDSSALREFDRVLKFEVPVPRQGRGPPPPRSDRPGARMPPQIDTSVYAEARVQAAGAACQGLIEGFAQAGEGALARKYREIGRAAAEKIERASGFQIDRPTDGLSISDRIIVDTLQDRGQTQVALDWAKSAINPAAIT